MERQALADSDDLSRQTERLEAAVDRIAAAASRPATRIAPATEEAIPAEPIPSTVIIDTAAVAGRLDTLIARLRAAVGDSQ